MDDDLQHYMRECGRLDTEVRRLTACLSDGAKWIIASERKPTVSDLPIVFRQAGSRDHFCIDWPSELERVLNPRHENDRIIGLWFSLPKGPK